MTDQFTDRIREATVEPTRLPLDALKEAASNASTNLTAERALALVRVAHGRPVAAELDADLRNRINSEEALIGQDGDGQLLAVLATESLIALFARRIQDVGLAPALAIRCAGHAGWHPAHPDLQAWAESYLGRRSLEVRAGAPLESNLAKLKPRTEQEGPDRLREELEALRSHVRLDRQVLYERSRLAWWLLGETRPREPIDLAREFAKCLVFLPEPVATDELIAAKLKRRAFDSPTPGRHEAPRGVDDLCADLLPDPPEREAGPEAVEARRLLDQLLLARTIEEARK